MQYTLSIMESNKMANPENDHNKVTFTFEPIPHDFKHETCSRRKEMFFKWNLIPGLVIQRYQIKPCIMKGEEDLIIRELCKNHLIFSMPRTVRKDFVDTIHIQELRCNSTRMDLFKAFIDNGIISNDGHIMGCFDYEIQGILVQDKLRELLANNESENLDGVSSSVQCEFLFQLLKLICVGGSMCQAETNFKDYREATRDLYKELVQVDRILDDVKVTSKVFHVDPDGTSKLFPVPSMHNKCFIIIDVVHHACTMMYKPYESFW